MDNEILQVIRDIEAELENKRDALVESTRNSIINEDHYTQDVADLVAEMMKNAFDIATDTYTMELAKYKFNKDKERFANIVREKLS